MIQNIIAGIIIAAAVVLSAFYLVRMFRGAVKGDTTCNCEKPGHIGKTCEHHDGRQNGRKK